MPGRHRQSAPTLADDDIPDPSSSDIRLRVHAPESGERIEAAPSRVFLVVEDERDLNRLMARLLARLGEVEVAYTLQEALVLVAGRREWTAHFIDVRLPDGDGLDVVEATRARGLRVPTLVVTADPLPALVNRAHDLGAEMSCKADDMNERVLRFAAAAVAEQLRQVSAIAGVVSAWAARYSLTSAEAFILRCSVRGTPRDDLAEILDVLPATVKKHVHNLVQKTGDGDLDAAIQRALHEALAGK